MPTALSLLALHVAGVIGYGAWVARRVADGAPAWPYVLALPCLYALLVLTITLADFSLAWLWRSPRPPDARIGMAATLRMMAQEFRALLPSALRMMAYPFAATPPVPRPDHLPVILVHGVMCNAGVWSTVAAACARAGIAPVYRLSYGPPLASIDDFAEQLAQLVARVRADTGAARVIVVAHSMGGLVVRAYLQRGGGAKVAQVITLGTPNRGSRFAGLMVGTCLAQMRPGSAWLAALPPEAPATPPFTALWSWHDSMVAPQLSCLLLGATNTALVGIGHNALLHDAGVTARVVALLRAARDRPAAATVQGQAG